MILEMFNAYIQYAEGYKLATVTNVSRRNDRAITHACKRIIECNGDNIVKIKIYTPEGDLMQTLMGNHQPIIDCAENESPEFSDSVTS